MKEVAVKIKTDDWNKIISGLIERGWFVSSKYYGFDAGIDNDFLILRKGFKKIIFGWDNWNEGEIKCSKELHISLEEQFNIKFVYGKPTNLKPMVIFLYKLQSLPLFILKRLKII